MASILGSGSVHHQGRRRMVRSRYTAAAPVNPFQLRAYSVRPLPMRPCRLRCAAASHCPACHQCQQRQLLCFETLQSQAAPFNSDRTAGAEPGRRQRGRGVPAVPADGALDVRVQECARVQGTADPHPAAHAAQGTLEAYGSRNCGRCGHGPLSRRQ